MKIVYFETVSKRLTN